MFCNFCFCVLLQMEDLDLPEIKRKKIQEKKVEDKKEFKDLFQSDSESDDEDGGFKIKRKLMMSTFHSHVILFCKGGKTSGYDVLSVLASRGLCFVTAWSPTKSRVKR